MKTPPPSTIRTRLTRRLFLNTMLAASAPVILPTTVLGAARRPAASIHYTYANGVKLSVKSNRPGIRFEGTLGRIGTQGWTGAPEAEPESILQSQIGEKETQLYTAPDEHRNFLDCVKSRQPCCAPAGVGHRPITIAHLGNIAMKLGRKLKWNPDTERFVGDDSANAMLSRPRRAPWTLPEV